MDKKRLYNEMTERLYILYSQLEDDAREKKLKLEKELNDHIAYTNSVIVEYESVLRKIESIFGFKKEE